MPRTGSSTTLHTAHGIDGFHSLQESHQYKKPAGINTRRVSKYGGRNCPADIVSVSVSLLETSCLTFSRHSRQTPHVLFVSSLQLNPLYLIDEAHGKPLF